MSSLTLNLLAKLILEAASKVRETTLTPLCSTLLMHWKTNLDFYDSLGLSVQKYATGIFHEAFIATKIKARTSVALTSAEIPLPRST